MTLWAKNDTPEISFNLDHIATTRGLLTIEMLGLSF